MGDTPPPIQMSAPSWSDQLAYTLMLSAAVAEYCAFACVQVQHWATYRPRGSARVSLWSTFRKMQSGKRRPFLRGMCWLFLWSSRSCALAD